MIKLRVLDIFSGIGGFSLGLERTGGFETVAFCEIEPFPRRVLAKHWPGVPIYDDVRTLTGDVLARDGIAVDVITGGFPCQDISTAGRRAGINDGTRSGLWSEIARLAGELRPRFVIVENVANLLAGPTEQPGGWFGRVLGDLAECGYDAEWENIPASALGASHRRERVWIVAYPSEDGNKKLRIASTGARTTPSERAGLPDIVRPVGGSGPSDVPYPNSINAQGQQPRCSHAKGWERPVGRPSGPFLAGIRRHWEVEPDLGRVAHGIPDGAHRLSALGNAVVPQIPELIGRAILASEAAA